MIVFLFKRIRSHRLNVPLAAVPLEKIAIIMNSSQVAEAKGDLARLSLAFRLTFKEGPLGPFKVVGRASLIAWSLQYSVMGFVFMLMDTTLSKLLDRHGVGAGRTASCTHGGGCVVGARAEM